MTSRSPGKAGGLQASRTTDPSPPSAATPNPVIVLGMHRSGTSLTAHILGDLGWHLGRPEELLGPREDNPDGFFERADVQVLNDLILSRMGASWDGPPEPDELLELDGEISEQLSTVVTRLMDAASPAPFALKDPRLCVLWPLWERHLSPTATLVLIFRHPAEVAASLQKRDGLPLATGLALWEEYVRRSLVSVGDRGAVVIRYDELIDQPDEGIQSLADALGATVPQDRLQTVRPELNRNRDDARGVRLSASQSALWSWIEQLPRSVDQIDLDDIPRGPSESSIELVRSRRRSATLEAELARQAENQARLEQTIRESAAELAREREHHATVADTLREERESKERALVAATTELAVLRDRVRHHQAVRARQESEIERNSARLTRLAEERALLDEHVEILRQRRLEQAERMEALRLERDNAAALLEQSRAEFATAMAEKHSGEQVARLRERVLVHEREQLRGALIMIEGERRAKETAVLALQSSRTWRWGRRIARPMGRRSARGENE